MPVQVGQIGTIRHQAATGCKFRRLRKYRKSARRCQAMNLILVFQDYGTIDDGYRRIPDLNNLFERPFQFARFRNADVLQFTATYLAGVFKSTKNEARSLARLVPQDCDV